MFINYAHRGASAYAPENTLSAFRLGLELGANGIETDVRLTRDGVPVLFHDADLTRLTGAADRIADMTLAGLGAVRIPSPDGSSSDSVPTLAQFLSLVRNEPVNLAIEIKSDGLGPLVVDAISRFGVADRTVVTSFDIDYIRQIKALSPSQAVGLLVREETDGILSELEAIGAEQICPKATVLTPELVSSLRRRGFSVRAWGVRDEETMKYAVLCGVDGMTVNFPDKLRDYLAETGLPTA